MNEQTVRALNAINRSFYRDRAEDFSATRGQPWPGWARLAAVISERLPRGDLGVLDVGCGNGRFGAFLADALVERRAAIRYTGVDSSEPLLERARARSLPFGTVEFVRADLVEGGERGLPPGRFWLIVLYGVLHHVPGALQRQALLRRLASQLSAGGLLAIASWQFEAFERFRNRLVRWQDYNRARSEKIDTSQLEPGDHLLPWGDRGDAVRYCHFASEAETRSLLASVGLEVIASYAADGREGTLNRHFICDFSNAQVEPKEGGTHR